MSDSSWEVEFDNVKHVVRLKLSLFEGFQCQIFFDRELVEERKADWHKGVRFAFERGGHKFETENIQWSFSPTLFVDGVKVMRGTPYAIPPRSTDSSVAKPGNGDSDVAKPSSGYELVSEDNIQENTEVIATEEYPLDNRAGAETLTIEQEISRTASNEITVGSTT